MYAEKEKKKVKVRPEPLRLMGPDTVRACQDSAASAYGGMMWPAPCPATLTFPSSKGPGTHLLLGGQENDQWPDSYPYQESNLAYRCRRRVL